MSEPLFTLPDLLRASAEQYSDDIAIRDVSGGAWAYIDVWTATYALAKRLQAAGVRPGDLVPLVARRRAGAPVAMAAIMLAGATYVPIDPSWPYPRQQRVAAACDPALIVSVDADTALAGRLETVRLQTAELLEPAQRPAGDEDSALEFKLREHAPAYVIFTSGSTGRPKGVPVTARAAASLVSSVAALVGLNHSARMVALSSFAFDISVFEIFGTWAAGGELVLADDDQLLPMRLAKLLLSDRATYVQLTPSVLASLLDAGLVLPADTVLLLAGERLRRTLVTQVAHLRQVWNLYGPTETTIYATAHRCLPLPEGTDEDLPIGQPVAGAILEIRDDAGGTDAGELVIGGPGVALGYLGEQELSQQVFSSEPTGRWYRSGDLVRRHKDGSLTFVGRVDRQVKVRGNRVELDEIEGVVARLLGHTNVAVEAADDEHLGIHVAAFVQAITGDDLADLRERIAGELPAYMVPSKIHRLPRLPITSSGKIDRRALADRKPGA